VRNESPKTKRMRNPYRGVAVVLVLTLTMLFCADARGVEFNVVTPQELWALFDKKGIPQYPWEARRSGITGSGIYRMYIDPDGNVRTVGVMKSTGNKFLDIAAAGGLYQWHAIPTGKRREIDMPVTFTGERRFKDAIR